MDALKTAEVKRMEYGGNKPWKAFFNEHQCNKVTGQTFEGCTIAERYDSEAGEEWKDRLTAKVEGTEYVPGTSRKVERSRSAAAESFTAAGSGRNTPLANNARATPQRIASPSQKQKNEAYFASKGSENASRPDYLLPSQGGKFGGFGSEPPPSSSTNSSSSIPSGDDFQKDPVAALTKGFGWLSSTVTKQAATLNTAYIQPGMRSLQEADIAAQARQTALQAGTLIQQGTKGVGDQFNKFVDPDAAPAGREPEKKDFWESFGQAPAGPPREKKDFWDDFAAAGETATQGNNKQSKPASIGTSAMRSGSGGGGPSGKKEDDGWGAW
ncbi:ADP-ribosylation factor GTPase-activating protein gcs1 [Vermiconidia calcicola]|uniref:ADP-ribosylation factor GTPase-activating protein gcs1 n=1 Tax=Vermiconidia calcicola TaxID=1690605 RepID=A0ACC3NJY9_9PEZI|nr:ADP-ribosylation factor GTPase-activating protein gcs1 [Vermiconidia calcicola]